MKIQTIIVGGLGTNCYVVYDEETRDAAVVDPGSEGDAISLYIRRNGLTVRDIFLTHGHFDHSLAAEPLRSQTGARVVVHRDDAGCLRDAHTSLYLSMMSEPYRAVEADVFLFGGEETQVGSITFEFMHTPGHSPGSMCIFAENVIFTGDTLFQGDCGRTDLLGGDEAALMRSLRRLYRLEGDYILYPGHGDPSALSMERMYNYQLRRAGEN